MDDREATTEGKLYPYPGKKTRSRVWTYFGFRKIKEGPANKENLDMSKSVCKLCKKEYAFKGNTTNFGFHLDHEHPETKTTNGSDIVQQQMHQSTINFKKPVEKIKMDAATANKINDALMKLLVGKALPLSLVDNEHFRNFVSLLNPKYEVPSRKTMTRSIEKKKLEMKSKLKEDISHVKDIAITHDGWTSINTESFSTVTGHFINKNWELRSVVLETKKMTGSHTGENIKQSLETTKTTWNLPTPTAVTDNAANERKAFELLQWTRFGCYGHRINLIVKNALALPDLTKIITKGRKLVTYFHQSSSITDLLMAKQQLLLDEHLRGHKLIMDCPTRWNSSYLMLERLLEQTPAIMAVISDNSCQKNAATTLKSYVYSFEEQLHVEKLVSVLKPFLSATTITCGDKSPTLQKVILVVKKLQKCIEIQDDDPSVIQHVKKKMKSELESRTQDIELATLACMLNPFTKNLDFLPIDQRIKAHNLLLNTALDLGVNVIVKKEPNLDENANADLPSLPNWQLNSEHNIDNHVVEEIRTGEPNEGNEPNAKKPKVSEDMDEWLNDIICVGETVKPAQDVIEQEVARYLGAAQTDTELTILQWWSQNAAFYPRLSVLAKKFLSIPASSVSSERVFSLAGHLVNKKRARLSPENIDNIIFMNKNMEFYW